MRIRLSELDRARWGIETAIAADVAAPDVGGIVSFCRENGVVLAIARCDAADTRAAHALERAGFLLMDTLVYFVRTVDQPPAHADVRSATAADARAVRRVAAEAFSGYHGHYHADDRLDPAAADEVYADWAERSVTGELADAVLLVELDGAVAGFVSLRRNGADEAEIVLNGVAPSAQRRGLYRSLVAAAIEWARDRGSRRLIVSTQLPNVAVQRAWTRLGFEPLRAVHTFHAWI